MSIKLSGSYDIHAGNYDWGCSVDYAILHLVQIPEDVDILDVTTWKVTERKMVTDLDSVDRELHPEEFVRKVTGISYCDEKGEKSDMVTSHLKIALEVGPETGSPLVFTSRNEIFIWSDPYELHFYLDSKRISLHIDSVFTKKTTDADIFDKKIWTSKDGIVYPYAEYIPEQETRTLYVWLHGLGEGQIEGSDAYLPVMGRKGTSMAGKAFQEKIGGARVLVPQCPTYWMDGDGTGQSLFDGEIHADGTSYYTESLEEMIDEYAAQMQAEQIILAGCSNGGYMSLVLAMNRPHHYAAVIPICEAVPDERISDAQIRALAEAPLYFVYSEDDPIVLPEKHEIPTIKRLKEAGAKELHVSVTEHVEDTSGLYKDKEGKPYRYLGHLSWIYYDNDETDDGEGLSAWDWIARMLKK